MYIIKIFSIALVASGLIGCATPMSHNDRAALRQVYISPIQLPEEPKVFRDPSAPSLVARGALGEVIYAPQKPFLAEPITYLHTLEKNNIDVAALVLSELRSQLSAKGIRTVEKAEDADAILNVQMLMYGSQTPWASTGHIPYVWPKLILTRKGGVIWSNWGGVDTHKLLAKEVKSYPLSDYLKDAKLLDSQIRKTNRVVIESLLSTL